MYFSSLWFEMKNRLNLEDLKSDAEFLPSYRVNDRWGVVSEPGFLSIPDVLLMHQKELGISSEELNVLLNVLAHWWRPESKVFPRTSTIAFRMGASLRSVQRAMQSLVKKGLIKRDKTNEGVTYYDVTPLRDALTPYAQIRLKMQKDAAEARHHAALDDGGAVKSHYKSVRQGYENVVEDTTSEARSDDIDF
jgi:DNA replication protein DnaD